MELKNTKGMGGDLPSWVADEMRERNLDPERVVDWEIKVYNNTPEGSVRVEVGVRMLPVSPEEIQISVVVAPDVLEGQ